MAPNRRRYGSQAHSFLPCGTTRQAQRKLRKAQVETRYRQSHCSNDTAAVAVGFATCSAIAASAWDVRQTSGLPSGKGIVYCLHVLIVRFGLAVLAR